MWDSVLSVTHIVPISMWYSFESPRGCFIVIVSVLFDVGVIENIQTSIVIRVMLRVTIMAMMIMKRMISSRLNDRE